MTTPLVPYWVDTDYDQDQASDGRSRYSSYVRQASDPFDEALDRGWHSPAGERERFAAVAWRQATSPVMAPGYVREHERIQSTFVDVSDWDGLTLLAVVNLTVPQPPNLRWVKTLPGDGDDWWHDWPSEKIAWSGATRWHNPSDEEIADHPHLLTTMQLRFRVETVDLPLPLTVTLAESSRYGGPREAAAHRAVEVLVGHLNQVVAPAMTAILEANG